MQHRNWDHYRFILAVYEAGTIADAANKLGVNDSTVSRRLTTAEEELDVKLFDRINGKLSPTDVGKSVMQRLHTVNEELQVIESRIAGADYRLEGAVRITSVPVLVNYALIPKLHIHLKKHSKLDVEIVSDSANLSIAQREADIALRFSRPTSDPDAITKKVGELEFGAYIAESAYSRNVDVPWVSYEKQRNKIPQAQWIEESMRKDSSRARVYVNDLETMLHCVRNGLGKSFLPSPVANHFPDLKKLPMNCDNFKREIWILIHPNYRIIRKIDVTTNWAIEAIEEFINL